MDNSLLKVLICLTIILPCCGTGEKPAEENTAIDAVVEAAREASKNLEGITIKDYLCLASCDLLDKNHIECEKCK